MRQYSYILLIISFFTGLLITCTPGTDNLNEQLKFDKLFVDYLPNPLGIDNPAPRFTWIVTPGIPDGKQSAYHILVASDKATIGRDEGDIWDSGKVISRQSAQVEYEGEPLRSGQKYFWKVRIWDQQATVSAFSEANHWEMGLTETGDWKGEWISAPTVFDWELLDQRRKQLAKNAPPEKDELSPIFRKEFNIKNDIKSARAYVSGLGYYEFYLNGEKVGKNILDPAFTDYEKSVLYQAYDVTSMLKKDANSAGIMLGNGWYDMSARGVWGFDKAPWRADPAFLLEMRIEYQDGSRETLVSDTSWRCFPGPITFNCIRQGEFYDARMEEEGWMESGYDESKWQEVRVVRGPRGLMRSQVMPPIRVGKSFSPVSINRISGNTWVCDFGQNMAGFAEITVKNAGSGIPIRLKYGELLYPDGTVDQSNIDGLVADEPFQTDEYITAGRDVEVWHPRFVYHGFRYLEITGFPGILTEENIKAMAVHTSFDKKGSFESSSRMLNQTQVNTEWSFLNNYHGYPTDCPQREKNGWTGDAQLASEMALFNYRVENAYDKWVQDIVDAQKDKGIIPSIVPTGGWGYHWGNGPAWDYTLVVLPWHMYIYSGDRQVLERYYPAMKKYMDFLATTTEDNVVRWGLGDWVPARTVTPPELITTAYYYEMAGLLDKIAGILGKKEDQQHFDRLKTDIREAFRNHFMDEELNIGNGSQTSMGCALYFGLIDSDNTGKVTDQLIESIRDSNLNLDFGVLGSKFVPNVLAMTGNQETAWEMIHTTEYPGWGNWVMRGATTLWESWDGDDSRNHVFFGDISAWFYKYLAGIRPDESHPGFSHFFIEPFFPGDLEWVNASTDSWYGTIKNNWERNDNRITMDLIVPFNTTCTVNLKEVSDLEITPEGTDRAIDPGNRITRMNEDISIQLGSGNYTIEFTENR